MGGDRVAFTSYKDAFWKSLPYYLSIGMTADEFWHGDPQLVVAYRLADEKAARRSDWLAWLNGRYVYEAIGDNAPVLRAFSKATRANDYPKEPYTEREERRRRERELGSRLDNGRIAANAIAERMRRMQEHVQKEGGKADG